MTVEPLSCHRCDESIADADIDAGKAVRVGSDVFHVGCAFRRAMSGPGRGLSLVVALLVLLSVATAAYAVVAVRDVQARVKGIEGRPVEPVSLVAGPAPTVSGPTSSSSRDPSAPARTTEEEAEQHAAVGAAIDDLASGELSRVWSAAGKLGNFGDLAAVEPLIKVLKDHADPFARTAAAHALGKLKACDAVPSLLAALLDREGTVMLAAAQAFGRIVEMDASMTGMPTRKERNDAQTKWTTWWAQNEQTVRKRLNQPKAERPK